ncbi:Atypical/ABC1/ABC1-A protein kinase [Trichoderma gamsii]|uniref:Atypical/ABC1/ABC1-A protein kinase n=1 Tax=Trichoderma gamsii TaxID=398673 RepID=A0A2P5A139_9HYPO|nr:Atypical/ABC1/ABC1-A protein kinase [Trichoderma gamsii]PON30254.1 Atypical/ABC1/ABC1-A protein kinase [Trichoderma gamsii]
MGFVDFAIDLAAVLSASRSVASKHVALRGRQLDVYSRTSSVGAILRSRDAAAAAAATDSVTTEATEKRKEPDSGNEATNNEFVNATEATGKKSSQSAAPSTTAPERPKPTDFKPREQPIFKTSGPDSDFVRQRLQQASAPPPTKDELNAELGAPEGVDVNIFHTTRGSQILDSLRKQRKQAESQTTASSGGAAKEHPLRHWPPPHSPPVESIDASASTPPAAPEAKNSNIEDIERKSQQPDVQQPESLDPAVSGPNSAPPEPQPATEPVSIEKERSDASKVDQEMVETVKASVLPETPQTNVHTYQLRESKVPATRFSRILNYGGLAAGMLGGAVTESMNRAFGGGGEGSVLLSGGNMERLVAKLSRMRGAALKLGQMMSFQDSKMLPAPLQEVLQRVQDRADYMPAWQRDRVLASNLGSEWRDLFSEFEEKPIAAASIGQVHKAVLKSNGKRVAVKIQFPGVADSINSDLDNLGILLTATKLLPKGLYLNKTIDNARLELGWECDYLREAECANRYKQLLRGEEDVFEAPDVYPEASGKQVLTMDFLDGIGVTRVNSFTQEQRDWIGTQILRLCLREITEFKFMQTDPNWTNFLYNAATNKLELLDFGASREFPEEFISQYVRLLESASRSDREGVKRFSEGLGYLTGHESRTMLDAHIQSVLTLAEPFLDSAPEVYDFKDQTITERVKALIPVMLHERLAPPPEETYSLHRKLSGAFLLCARLESKVRCRDLFANSVARSGYVERT